MQQGTALRPARERSRPLPRRHAGDEAAERIEQRRGVEGPALQHRQRLHGGFQRRDLVRAARRADQVSTLEATVQALAMLEGRSFDAAPLLDAFGRFVAGVAARQRPGAFAGRA